MRVIARSQNTQDQCLHSALATSNPAIARSEPDATEWEAAAVLTPLNGLAAFGGLPWARGKVDSRAAGRAADRTNLSVLVIF
jgi:hypothetical protein